MLSFKTAFLLALASAKCVSDIHALSAHPECTQFIVEILKGITASKRSFCPKEHHAFRFPNVADGFPSPAICLTHGSVAPYVVSSVCST